MSDGCHNCDNCRILGYNPKKFVNTISYWCNEKDGHTSTFKKCEKWSKGNPWKKVTDERRI